MEEVSKGRKLANVNVADSNRMTVLGRVRQWCCFLKKHCIGFDPDLIRLSFSVVLSSAKVAPALREGGSGARNVK